MRRWDENADDAVYRIVVERTYEGESPRVTRSVYGPYATKPAASGGLTKELKERWYQNTQTRGWIESVPATAWARVGDVREGK